MQVEENTPENLDSGPPEIIVYGAVFKSDFSCTIVSKNRGTPKWMVYNGKPYQNGWFGGFSHIFGNTHMKVQVLQEAENHVLYIFDPFQPNGQQTNKPRLLSMQQPL